VALDTRHPVPVLRHAEPRVNIHQNCGRRHRCREHRV